MGWCTGETSLKREDIPFDDCPIIRLQELFLAQHAVIPMAWQTGERLKRDLTCRVYSTSEPQGKSAWPGEGERQDIDGEEYNRHVSQRDVQAERLVYVEVRVLITAVGAVTNTSLKGVPEWKRTGLLFGDLECRGCSGVK